MKNSIQEQAKSWRLSWTQQMKHQKLCITQLKQWMKWRIVTCKYQLKPTTFLSFCLQLLRDLKMKPQLSKGRPPRTDASSRRASRLCKFPLFPSYKIIKAQWLFTTQDLITEQIFILSIWKCYFLTCFKFAIKLFNFFKKIVKVKKPLKLNNILPLKIYKIILYL